MQSNVLPDWTKFDFGGLRLPVLVVYQRPTDFPDKFVVRLFDLQTATEHCTIHDSYEQARNAIPRRFAVIARHPNDEPQILETWV